MISLIGITRESFHRFQGDILEIEMSSFPTPWSPNAFRDEIKNPISYLWGLITHEELVGYICFRMFIAEIHLMNIAVHRMRQGEGLGHYLLAKMIELGIEKAVDTAWLEVRPSNLVARILYQKIGFQEIGRRPRYYRDTNEDAIVMSLSLLSGNASGRNFGGKPTLLQVQ